MKPFFSAIVLMQIFETNSLGRLTCGVDGTNTSRVYEGVALSEHYPWMGFLFYKSGNKRFTTAVVLVSKQIVICSASEIDKLPKTDFRANCRVALGSKCEEHSVGVREYSLDPGYPHTTYSALAIVQLETDLEKELTPICPPPKYFIQPQIFAMSLNNCKSGQLRIFEMTYVSGEECHTFYRRNDLDLANFWPEHPVCARGVVGGGCTWRSGTVLAVKQDGHWRILGFGMYGPGCGSPSRFVDYNMHQNWVRTNIDRAGYPAITRMADNLLIMRRSLGSVQRFGPCDPEETQFELYTDKMTVDIIPEEGNRQKTIRSLKYNVSLVASVDYSCVVFRADPPDLRFESEESAARMTRTPKIYLRRWCAGPPQLCYGFQHVEIHFFLEATLYVTTTLSVSVYGRMAQILDPNILIPLSNIGHRNVWFPYYADVIFKYVRPWNVNSKYKRWFHFP